MRAKRATYEVGEALQADATIGGRVVYERDHHVLPIAGARLGLEHDVEPLVARSDHMGSSRQLVQRERICVGVGLRPLLRVSLQRLLVCGFVNGVTRRNGQTSIRPLRAPFVMKGPAR